MSQATSNTLSHLTDEERRLLELAEKATERPWRVDDIYADAEADIHAADGFPVARTSSTCIKPWEHLGIRHWSEAPKVAFIEREEDEVAANAAYIVEACNSIPALLTTIGQLRGELEGVKLERDEAVTLIRAYTHCNNAVYSCSVCPFRGIEDDCQVRWETDMRRITEKTESEASE